MFLFIFAGTMLGIVTIGLFTFSFTKRVLQRSIEQSQIEQAKQTMNKIDRMLYERYINIQEISREDSIENFVVDPEQAVDGQARILKAILKRLNELTVFTGPWDELFLVRKTGTIVASTEAEEIGLSVYQEANDKVVYEAAMRGEVYVSDLILTSNMGRPTVVFAAPIRDDRLPRHPVIGVVIGQFSWAAVLPILEEISAHAVLLDHQGRVIVSNTVYAGRPLTFFQEYKNKLIREGLRRGRPLSAILSKGQGFLNEEVLACLVPQPGYLSYRGSGWSLMLEVPSRIAFAPATQTAAKLVFLLVPIIMMTPLAILLIVMTLIIRPLGILNRTMHAITAGDLTQEVLLKSENEIGVLAASFNAMTSRLRKSRETLEQRATELSKANEDLKKEIADRKRLEMVALQSEKMAAVGQMASGLAHEISNPVSIILGFTQCLVKRISVDDPTHFPLSSIEREALRCKQLTQDLLIFSRTGKTEKNKVQIHQIIEDTVSFIAAHAKAKGVELLWELSAEPFEILANKGQIQQVIVNLVNNAIDAMPGGGKLLIRTKKSELNQLPAVQLEIEDTGTGIPREIQDKIFEPFFTTKEPGKGTGLGLSLVYEIIQKHEGEIKVESELGKGTVFCIRLPLN